MTFTKFKDFVIRERTYVWLLIFIVSLSIALYFTQDTGPFNKGKIEITYKNEVLKKILKKDMTKEEVLKLIQNKKGAATVFLLLSLTFMVAFILGLFLDFIILILKRERAVLMFPTVSQAPPRWGMLEIGKVVILFVWFGYMLILIESALSSVFPIIETDDNLRSVLNATILDSLAFIFILYFVVHEYKEKIVSLGLSLKGFLKNFFYGIAGYLATIPVLVLVMVLIIWISALFKYEPPAQPVLEIFFGEKKRALLIYLTIFVSVFGPIAEETFFRAFMYTAVKKRMGFKAALFSTSALFALLHTNLAGFLPIMVLGMLLAYLYEKTGTIVASCTVHILHNTVMVFLVLVMKGLLQ